ncbi:AT_hook domain-containing protein/DUF296 domain-containing protein [Cephalotus follicularis]|uniref:AT-hook motif nuclear-localized protein n=1 Tax=Cephalotus follicularis TaxID=3775 RepID=A0A1Q3BCU2_CEPFO|nr:AT_hook domain-containing protein/DUF296 domain-containing protein [Cephalotus follicularis]
MSGSENQKSPSVAVQTQTQPQVVQNMRFAFTAEGSPIYKPLPKVTEGSAAAGGSTAGFLMPPPPTPPEFNINNMAGIGTEQFKRKRGRPRKYGGQDVSMSSALVPVPQNQPSADPAVAEVFSPPPPPPVATSPTLSLPLAPAAAAAATPTPAGGSIVKKARGRPPGSSTKKTQPSQLQPQTLGVHGFSFTPYVINVKAGEDISAKIMSFSQQGPRDVCILSANGAISNAILRQQSAANGVVYCEGRFEILSLSGSFLLTENGPPQSRSGGLSVSLAGSDGHVFGGGVAGTLVAASPVQIVVASFVEDGRKESKSAQHLELKPGPGGGPTGACSPPSRGSPSESSGGPGSPLNLSAGGFNPW